MSSSDLSGPSDSQPQMDTLTEIAEALGLDASADKDTVLEAITKVTSERDAAQSDLEQAKDSGESLEDRAKEEGKVLVDADEFQSLSDRVATSEEKLADADFDKHFDAALNETRVDAKPETRERFRKLFDQDRETTLELLDAAAPLVNTKPEGKGGSDEIDDTPDGVDADSHKLNKKVKAYMKENDVTYVEALDAVQAETEGDLA